MLRTSKINNILFIYLFIFFYNFYFTSQLHDDSLPELIHPSPWEWQGVHRILEKVFITVLRPI